jgi:hypothetical protein
VILSLGDVPTVLGGEIGLLPACIRVLTDRRPLGALRLCAGGLPRVTGDPYFLLLTSTLAPPDDEPPAATAKLYVVLGSGQAAVVHPTRTVGSYLTARK